MYSHVGFGLMSQIGSLWAPVPHERGLCLGAMFELLGHAWSSGFQQDRQHAETLMRVVGAFNAHLWLAESTECLDVLPGIQVGRRSVCFLVLSLQ